MLVVIKTHPTTATALHHRERSTAAEELLQAVHGLGLDLAPMHPGAGDSELIQYFSIEVPDRAAAERLIHRLEQMPMIEAAYLKPDDELP